MNKLSSIWIRSIICPMTVFFWRLNMKIRPARIETDIPAVTRLINPYEATPVTEEQVRGWF